MKFVLILLVVLGLVNVNFACDNNVQFVFGSPSFSYYQAPSCSVQLAPSVQLVQGYQTQFVQTPVRLVQSYQAPVLFVQSYQAPVRFAQNYNNVQIFRGHSNIQFIRSAPVRQKTVTKTIVRSRNF